MKEWKVVSFRRNLREYGITCDDAVDNFLRAVSEMKNWEIEDDVLLSEHKANDLPPDRRWTAEGMLVRKETR